MLLTITDQGDVTSLYLTIKINYDRDTIGMYTAFVIYHNTLNKYLFYKFTLLKI
jgi:hypothetical protein